jgi:hypothetical protein
VAVSNARTGALTFFLLAGKANKDPNPQHDLLFWKNKSTQNLPEADNTSLRENSPHNHPNKNRRTANITAKSSQQVQRNSQVNSPPQDSSHPHPHPPSLPLPYPSTNARQAQLSPSQLNSPHVKKCKISLDPRPRR